MLRAEVTLKSIEPFEGKPAIFTIGGFSAVSKDGREYSFDWCEYRGYVWDRKDGHMVMDCELRDFDWDTFKEMNEENGVSNDDITQDFIVSSKLTEVYYECFKDDKEETFVPMEVVDFTIAYWDEMSQVHHKDFPKEEIERYNKENAIHLDRVVDKELELTDSMLQRNDVIDNAVHECICKLAEKELKWDMHIIHEVTEAIKGALARHGIRVRHPGVVTNTDGTQEYSEYDEPLEEYRYSECLRCGHIGDTAMVKAKIEQVGVGVAENISKILTVDEDNTIPLGELIEHKEQPEDWEVIEWDSFCPECGHEGYFVTEKKPGDLAWVDGGEMS